MSSSATAPVCAADGLALPPMPAQLTHANANAYLLACEQVLGWDGARKQNSRHNQPISAAAAASAPPVWLDASGLQQFDSSALALLLALARRVQSGGGQLRLQALPLRLRELAALYGVGECLSA